MAILLPAPVEGDPAMRQELWPLPLEFRDLLLISSAVSLTGGWCTNDPTPLSSPIGPSAFTFSVLRTLCWFLLTTMILIPLTSLTWWGLVSNGGMKVVFSCLTYTLSPGFLLCSCVFIHRQSSSPASWLVLRLGLLTGIYSSKCLPESWFPVFCPSVYSDSCPY